MRNRNLLGRLNARSRDDVARIAETWRIGVDGNDRLGLVTAVFRALTDLRTIRDLWQALPEEERALVVALDAGPDVALTIPELAAVLNVSEDDVRLRAASLFQKGLVVREGDDAELRVGELPRLFLPREIAIKVKRVRAEITAGDISAAPLETLLGTLDDAEIEQAADAWGIHVIAGLKSRPELIRAITAQIEDPLRRETVTAKLTGLPAKIWRRVRAEPSGQPVELSEALAAAELNEHDPRAVHRGRLALGDLEEKLLVWHAWRGDQRMLFIPAEIREPGRRMETTAAAPAATPATRRSEPSPDRSHAVAWDLLTLIRFLTASDAPEFVDIDDAPRGWLRKLNLALWNRAGEEPPEGYLSFLLDLAAIEQLLEGGDAAANAGYVVTREMRNWRTRPFAEQSARLREDWLKAPVWIEASARGDVEIWGAEWPSFRAKLLAQLAALADREWRAVDEATLWLANRDLEMLGGRFRAATARATAVAGDERASRAAAIAEVVAGTLGTAGAWFGLVDITSHPRQGPSIRLTELGAAFASGQPAPEGPKRRSPAFDLSAGGDILIHDPSPLRVWSVLAFAETVELSEPARFRLTESSVRRALGAGFDIAQITAFLAKETAAPLPTQVEALLRTWSKSSPRVRVKSTIALEPDDPGELAPLAKLIESNGGRARRLEKLLLVEFDDPASEERAVAILRANGYLVARS